MRQKILFAALMVCSFLAAQEPKLGRVTVDELKETVHPLDSSAAAAILFKTSYVTIKPDPDGRWIIEDETKVKIKIYKKEGYSYANFEALLYEGKLNDVMIFYDEATYNLVNGKVEKTKMKNESIFTEKRSKYYSVKKITLPNVKEGSIIEYRFIKTSHVGGNLDKFYMQYDIPVNYISYTVDAPVPFVFNKVHGGYLPLQAGTAKLTGGSYDLNRDKYVMQNVPAMRDEDFVDNINNYRAHLSYELSAYQGSKYRENFAQTWDDVVKNIYNNEDFGGELSKKNYFEADLAPIIAGVTDRDELVAKIFRYVQARMNWNDYLGYYAEKGVKKAYAEKTGNVADINLMLTAMLRHAGVDASPILVSTRSNGVNITPSRTAFNYVISAVEIPDGLILLDATSKYSKPNVLPKRAINWFGRIIREHGSSATVDLRPTAMSKEANTIMATIAADGSVSGKVRRQFNDYGAYFFRENYGSVAQDSYLEKLEGRYPGIEISEYNVADVPDVTNPVVEGYSFVHNNISDKIGDKIYLNPLLFFAHSDNPFKQEQRQYPVDFVYPQQDRYTITLTIPEGYTVESCPAPVTYAMEEGAALFKFNTSATGKQIQLAVTLEIGVAMLNAEYYPSLKRFFKEMATKQTEKIVLKPI